jgi:hypothetical protein
MSGLDRTTGAKNISKIILENNNSGALTFLE